MSTRGDDRPYKVVYSSRRREEVDDYGSSRRPRREVEYEDDYRRESTYSRDYRDDRIEVDRRSRANDSRTSLPSTVGKTKTTYAVGRDRNAEAYVKRSNAVIIDDRPGDHGRYEYEVLRPERRDDGAYVVDVGGGYSKDYVVDLDSRDQRYAPQIGSRRDDAGFYDVPRGEGRERVRDVMYKDVHVTEEIDDRYSRRGRATADFAEDVPPPARLRSAMRGRNSSPPDLKRRASVGFYRDQISHHDAGEVRHERPGAEAHLAGRYLVGNGDYEDDLYAGGYTRQNRSRSRSRGSRYGGRRSDPRLHEHDEVDEQRRTYTEETMRQYEYEDDHRGAYPPQRGHSRRRHHRHHRDDDDRYSHYDAEVVKKTTKDYY